MSHLTINNIMMDNIWSTQLFRKLYDQWPHKVGESRYDLHYGSSKMRDVENILNPIVKNAAIAQW